MTTDQIGLFSLFAAVFGLLLWGRFRYDLVAFAALMVGVTTGLVPVKEAFSGFGHPATIVVALVLVASAGLVRSGAVLLITRTMVDASRRIGTHIAVMGVVGGVLSAFMNNVAALALLMPVDIQTARKAGRAAGATLMPLSFATILGGMATLIGTPPNIIIAATRGEATGTPFAMLDFLPVGGITALVGIAFVALVGWRLIPKHDGPGLQGDPMHDYADYIAELSVPRGSKLIGQRLSELYGEADRADIAILGLIRGGKRRYGTSGSAELRAGDHIVVEASPEALDEFRASLKLTLHTPKGDKSKGKDKPEAAGEGMALVEAVVPADARMAGKTAQALGLAWRQNTMLLGLSRKGRAVRTQMRRTVIRPGDILLLLAPKDRVSEVLDWMGCLALADRGLSVTLDRKVWLAIGLFGAAVLAASLGLIYLPVALGLVVVGYILTGVLPLSEVYDQIEWPVVVLLGSMIPLGAALESSGGTQLIAGALIGLTEGWPAWAVLTVLMVVTMTLSDVLNNTATTIVAAPVGIQMATTLGVSADPFLMAVAVAASCAFLTPIGHKNNTLVLGPGGYRFGDYWQMGLPLELLVVAVSIPSILVFWPL